MTNDIDPRHLCEVLSDADKHAEWLIARGYEVFGGCAWKKGEEGQSRRIVEVVKQEAERCIAGAIWESDQRAAEADDRIQELEAAVRRWKEQSFRPLGDNHHNAALCPHCGGLLRKVKRKLGRLIAAIRKHHAARGHERCWENDADLYRAAGIEPGDPQLPPRDEFRARCQQYEAEQYGDAQSTATPQIDVSKAFSEARERVKPLVEQGRRAERISALQMETRMREAQPPAEAIDAAAPWSEMLAQAETVFRNVLETSPVLAELRDKLDALQNATSRAMVADRILDAGRRWLSGDYADRRVAEEELKEAIRAEQKTTGSNDV